MPIRRIPFISALAGAASWSGLEYGLHRFAMHEMRGRGIASREHLNHHAVVTSYASNIGKLATAAATAAVVFPSARRFLGPRIAASYTTGLIAMYFGYEVIHRRIHTHPPRGKYGRWSRRSHFHHHFGAPMRNFGVTTPIWDRVLRSYDDPGIVSIPRRMAPAWMLDTSGDIAVGYVGDYLLKGAPERDQSSDRRDRAAAFSNTRPEL